MNKKLKIIAFIILGIILLYAGIVLYLAWQNGEFKSNYKNLCQINNLTDLTFPFNNLTK